jgi:CubicO group peptidase (beta-lactamase class C family)
LVEKGRRPVARLADQGKLSLDARVSDLLPWYRKDTGARLTLRTLLNHTSGLPDYMHLAGIGREGFRREAGDEPIDVKTFIQKWCSSDLAWEPGTKWAYSNSGYVILGAVVEQVTGRPFHRALQELLLDPAAMKDTLDLAQRPREVVPNLTPGYEKGGGEAPLNQLGYELLGEGRADAAVEVFRLVAADHAESWNAWDSLGEGLLAAGRKEEAREAYRPSLVINPGNTNGKEMLKKLGGG